MRALGLSAVLLGLTGCPSKQREPSADYEQARAKFTKLYGERLDEAFTDPRIAEIEALLALVPPESVDAESAAALQKRIDDGQARAAASRREVAEAVEAARTAPPFEGQQERAAEEGEGPEVVEPDAGVAAVDAGASAYPTVGMASEELARRFGTCFRLGQNVQVTGRGLRETWTLKDEGSCRRQFPAFTDSLLIIEDAKVLHIAPTSQLRQPSADAGGQADPGADSAR